MPGFGYQTRPADSESESADVEASSSSQDEVPVSKGRHNRRSSRMANGVHQDDHNSQMSGHNNAITGASPQLTQSNPNEHQPGAILRIRMRNFVTYASAEFKCGPSLNMIIGPNGTGKSTLVCAICLGLGWPPSCLGRAKEVGEYVKNGHREAEIEVELKGNGRSNLIIQRTIKREGNKSIYHINGREARHKQVKEVMRQFNIQVDNLCQFLPQDKVVEFAAMTPVQLLEQTQRAAAEDEMSEWHEDLKKHGTTRRKYLQDRETQAMTLVEMNSRQNQQRADVEVMRERKEIEQRRDLFRKVKTLFQYNSERVKRAQVVAQKKKMETELAALEEESAPLLNAVKVRTEYASKIESELKEHQRRLDLTRNHVKSITGKIETHKAKIEQCDADIGNEEAQTEKKKNDILELKKDIMRLEKSAEQAPPLFDPVQMNERIRIKDGEMAPKISERSEKIEQEKRRLGEVNNKVERRTAIIKELELLQSQEGQQKQKLARLSPDSVKAWDWIRENQANGLFKSVYAPPIVSCSVNNSELADGLETVISKGEMVTFTVTDHGEFLDLQNRLYGKNELSLHDVTIKEIDAARLPASYPRPSNEELRNMGFDGWLVDGITGPAPVISMLCEGSNIHRTAYTRQQTESQFESASNSRINRWVTSDSYYQVQFRREYSNHPLTMQSSLRKAHIWANQQVDHASEQALKRESASLEQDILHSRSEVEELHKSQSKLRQEIQDIREQKEALLEKKKELQEKHSKFSLIPMNTERNKSKLHEAEKVLQELEDLVAEKSREKERLGLERAGFAIELANVMPSVRAKLRDSLEAQLRLIEAQSDVNILQERNREVTNLLAQRENEVVRLEGEAKQLKDNCKELRRLFLKVYEELTEEEEAIIQAFKAQHGPDAGVDDADAEITSLDQRLELVHAGDPQLLENYEARAIDIQKRTERLHELEQGVEEIDSKIKAIREKWEPRLDALAEQISDAFSHNFEQIGCAGQVGIHKDEDDYSQWAIRIQVKFRENESLSILDSHRQSGGERAVSTIFYLMALQSLARSPFRVVDEINQGMDPRNERMVHERMVDIACSENTSQYFLITPKLLSNLKYHERMVVHTIYSGETMPEDAQLDLPKLADLALRIRKRGK